MEGKKILGKKRVLEIEKKVGIRWKKLKEGIEVGKLKESRKVEWKDKLIGKSVL